MNKIGIGLLTFVLCADMTTGVIFAQAKPTPTGAPHIVVQTTNPTPTPNTLQPTSTPTPTATVSTPQVTAAPTPLVIGPTTVLVQTAVTQIPRPTATSTPVPPTPTPQPKSLVVTTIEKPPANSAAQIITAPFNLVMNSLPQSYYNDQGLAPTTSRVLLAAAFLCLASGTILLSWPKLVRMKNSLFAPRVKQANTIPYLGFEA